MGLFKPAWQSNNREKVIRAIEAMTDEVQLAHIAKTDDGWAKDFALAKVTNQELIVDIAKNASDEYMRAFAVKKLHDDKILAEIVKIDKSITVRWYAVNNMTENESLTQEVYVDIAKMTGDRFDFKRSIGKERTDNEGYVIFYEEIMDIRIVAVERLTIKELLVDVAKNAADDTVREAAQQKLSQ